MHLGTISIDDLTYVVKGCIRFLLYIGFFQFLKFACEPSVSHAQTHIIGFKNHLSRAKIDQFSNLFHLISQPTVKMTKPIGSFQNYSVRRGKP